MKKIQYQIASGWICSIILAIGLIYTTFDFKKQLENYYEEINMWQEITIRCQKNLTKEVVLNRKNGLTPN
jgi:hypothetical protein